MGLHELSTSVTKFSMDTSCRPETKTVACVNVEGVWAMEVDDQAWPLGWEYWDSLVHLCNIPDYCLGVKSKADGK